MHPEKSLRHLLREQAQYVRHWKVLCFHHIDTRRRVVSVPHGRKNDTAVPVMPFGLMFACVSAVIGLLIGIIYAADFGAVFAGIPSTSGINLSDLGILFGVGQ